MVEDACNPQAGINETFSQKQVINKEPGVVPTVPSTWEAYANRIPGSKGFRGQLWQQSKTPISKNKNKTKVANKNLLKMSENSY